MSVIKLTRRQLEARRLKANYMVIVEKRDQKEVAKILGVSEKSMSHWAKRYNWKRELKAIKNKNGIEEIMEGYFELLEQHTSLQNRVKMKAIWAEYLQNLQASQ